MPVKASNSGVYFLGEQKLTEAVSVFLRYGMASSEVNQVASNLSAGLVLNGLIPSRGEDSLGMGFTYVKNGDEFRTSQDVAGTPVRESETTLEVTYRIEAVPGIAIQPDFQYVFNPGTDPALENAKVVAVRFEVSL